MRRIDLLVVKKAYDAIARHPDIKPGAKVVAIVILSHMSLKDGRCDPGVDTICREAGMNRAKVFKHLKALDELGVIKRTTYGGNRHCNAYAPDLRVGNSVKNTTVKASHEQDEKRDGQQCQKRDANILNSTHHCTALQERECPGAPAREGRAKGREPSRQGYMLHPVRGGKLSPGHDQIRQAAESRRQGRTDQAIAAGLSPEDGERYWLARMREAEAAAATS